MTHETHEPSYMKACIVAALRLADARGLMDVGIHLNSALLALDDAHAAPSFGVSTPIRLNG